MRIRISKSALLLLTMFQVTKAFTVPAIRRQARAALISHKTFQNSPSQIWAQQHSKSLYQQPSSFIQHFSTKLYSSTSSADTVADVDSLVGISWVQKSVAEVLNDAFDAKEVARAAALAKLEPKKKKKKKKKKQSDDAPPPPEEPQLTQEEKDEIGEKAAQAAKPFGFQDTMVTAATKLEFGDYQCNAAMGLARNVGMSPRDCAMKIVEGLRPLIGNIMEEPEIAGPGFINLRFKKEYLEKSVQRMSNDEDRLAVPLCG